MARTPPASKATLAADVWRDLFSFFWSSGSRNAMVVASQELGVTPGHVKALLELEPGQARPMRALADSLRSDSSPAWFSVVTSYRAPAWGGLWRNRSAPGFGSGSSP